MTNKKVIEIQDFEDKKSQNGKRYTRFKTSEGWMSAFEKDLIDELKKHEGNFVEVEVAEDGDKGWKNIRKFHNVAEDQGSVQEERPKVAGSNKHEKDPVGLAVDIWLELYRQCLANDVKEIRHEDLMTVAVDLVKLAQKKFKNGNESNKPAQNREAE